MERERILRIDVRAHLKKAFALVLVFSVAFSTLSMFINPAQALVFWDGWWEGGVEVTTAYKGDTVTAKWTLDNTPTGQYRARILRDILDEDGVRTSQVVAVRYYFVRFSGTWEYFLIFNPLHYTGEWDGTFYTYGYYWDLYYYDTIFGYWDEVYTLPDSYPPRLTVLNAYLLRIDVQGFGTTNPAPTGPTNWYQYRSVVDVTVNAIPDAGWSFHHWLLDGVDVGASNPYTFTMWKDRNLTAVFYEDLSWRTQNVPTSTHNPGDAWAGDIALDSWDNPHISYLGPPYWPWPENPRIRYLVYSWFDGSSWQLDTLDWDDGGWGSSLALDSLDRPHISYGSIEYDWIKYVHWDGTWQPLETVDTSVWNPRHTSLALNSSDNPHISFYDGYSRYASRDGAGWNVEYADSEYGHGLDSSLAFDSFDNPHIAYRNNTHLIYVNRDVTGWSTPYGIDLSIDSISIAIDSSDNPHISYRNANGLNYAKWTGARWDITTVDGPYIAEGCSLALDSLDRPHISYYDYDYEVLKYAWWDGTYWRISIAESNVGVSSQYGPFGFSTSIAVDSSGNPHITYDYFVPGAWWYNYVKYATTAPVNQLPVADANGPYTGIEGQPVTFDGSGSYDPDGTIVSYEWDFGDTNTDTGVSPTHTYTQAGTYTVKLTVTDNRRGTDADYTTATISETGPIADFSATPTSGPEPLTVGFTDLSSSYDGITGWEWDFDNNGVTDSTVQNPTYEYSVEGTYTVTLTVYEGDGDSATETKINYIVVSDVDPVAAFSAYPRGGEPPLTVSFTDQSTSYDGIVSWLWDFGDGQTSTEQNPTHPYTNEGTYAVSLTVYEADGDSDIETKVDYIIVRVGIINVVFEEAHLSLYTIGSNPAYYITGGYAEFANYLTTNGYFVSTIDPGTTIDPSVLAPVDVLIIVAPQSGYYTSEIDAIETWVKGGGKLLLISDWGGYGFQAGTIAARFGITQPFDMILDYNENAGSPYWPYYDGANLLAHPVTAGVTRVEMYASDGITSAPADEIPLIVTDSDGSAVWAISGSPALGVSVMSAIDRGGTAGSGRLVVITDSDLWGSIYDWDGDGDVAFYDSDNEILALNAINWLSATIPGDCDGDGDVDYDDLVILAVAYGSSVGDPAYDARADFDHDGDVDYDDLVPLAINYGT